MQFNRSDLADFYYFVAIAKHRSFRRAGLELGVSSSALSHALKGLESRLGVRLFNRTNRSVMLTAAGEAFHEAIGEHLSAINQAAEVLNHFRDAPSGRIRLNVPEDGAMYLLAPVVPVFMQRYPDIQLDIGISNRLLDVIEEGYDAGVRWGGTVPEDMIVQRLSAEVRWVTVGSPAYFHAHGHPQIPQALAGHTCLQLKLGNDRIYRWEFEKAGEVVTVTVPGAVTIDSTRFGLELVRAGAALIYVPEPAVADDLAAGRLEETLADWSPMGDAFHVYYSSRRQVPQGLRLLIDLIRELRPLGL